MSRKRLDPQYLLTPKELAQYWRVGVGTLQQWRQSGTGPFYIKIGGKVMYPRQGILKYEKNRRYVGTAHRITDGDENEK